MVFFSGVKNLEIDPRKKYKCRNCFTVFNGRDAEGDNCPQCGSDNNLYEMCELDHLCTCTTEVQVGVVYCPKCGEPCCPGCGSHDVAQLSRVTGYLQEVSGWNSAKRQELKDRARYNVV